jgi:hypothetical protein
VRRLRICLQSGQYRAAASSCTDDGGPVYEQLILCTSLFALLTAPVAHAQPPQVHRLEATPASIAYGYYWSGAPPVLRIASGDVIDVDTLLTNTPEGLAKAGVPDDRIQSSLKAIVSQVTGERRGPGARQHGGRPCPGGRTRQQQSPGASCGQSG